MGVRSELTMQENHLVDPEVATLEAGGEAVVIPEVNFKGLMVNVAHVGWELQGLYCRAYLNVSLLQVVETEAMVDGMTTEVGVMVVPEITAGNYDDMLYL